MWFFHQKFNLSAHQRRVVMAVLLTMVSTTTRVQTVSASGPFVENAPSEVFVDNADDVPLSRGLIVPDQIDRSPKQSVLTSSAQPTQSVVVPVSAFTSDPRETDSTPFITASGKRVRDGIVAANFVKLGTRIRIPEYFGDKIFVVEDRMNARYHRRIDIWMARKADAYKWGVRNVRVEILP